MRRSPSGRMTWGVAVAAFVSLAAFWGAPSAAAPDASGPAAPPAAPKEFSPTEMWGLVEGNTAFAIDLYGKLKQTPGNVFFSPFSVSAALAMAETGSRGETEKQMAKVLRLDLPREKLHDQMGFLLRSIASRGKGKDCEVSLANALWAQKGHPFLPEFLGFLKDRYAAGMEEADFQENPEAAAERINKWVEERTKKRIRDIVSPGSINLLTRLVLANAVYFKGAWEDPFDKEMTKEEPFRLADGKEAKAPLMHTFRYDGYFGGKGFQALDVEYKGGGFSMLVLLPGKPDGLPALEATLSAIEISRITAKLKKQSVEVFLPRFKMEPPAADLCKALSDLGMPDAFSAAKADFSGINGKKPGDSTALHIAAVLHKAFVDVDEEGTEAAAATIVSMETPKDDPGEPPPPPPVFRADRPFLFFIRDRSTGTVLFMGRVANPKG